MTKNLSLLGALNNALHQICIQNCRKYGWLQKHMWYPSSSWCILLVLSDMMVNANKQQELVVVSGASAGEHALLVFPMLLLSLSFPLYRFRRRSFPSAVLQYERYEYLVEAGSVLSLARISLLTSRQQLVVRYHLNTLSTQYFFSQWYY